MAKIAALMTGGGTSVIDYDFVKSVVDSHTNTYDWIGYNSKATVNSGGVYVDTTNKILYMYADYDISTTSSPSSWNAMIVTNPRAAYAFLLAPASSNSTGQKLVNIYSTTATNNPVVNLYPYNSDCLMIGHTTKVTAGENFKVWGIWSIRTA